MPQPVARAAQFARDHQEGHPLPAPLIAPGSCDFCAVLLLSFMRLCKLCGCWHGWPHRRFTQQPPGNDNHMQHLQQQPGGLVSIAPWGPWDSVCITPLHPQSPRKPSVVACSRGLAAVSFNPHVPHHRPIISSRASTFKVRPSANRRVTFGFRFCFNLIRVRSPARLVEALAIATCARDSDALCNHQWSSVRPRALQVMKRCMAATQEMREVLATPMRHRLRPSILHSAASLSHT